MATRSRSKLTFNDYVVYVDATTGEPLHIFEFYNPHRPDRRTPPDSLVKDAVWDPAEPI